MVRTLRRLWWKLEDFDRVQIQREISRAIEDGEAGALCDVDQWTQILELPRYAVSPLARRKFHENKALCPKKTNRTKRG